MELRKAADVLRSQTGSLISFLTPTSASHWAGGVQLCYRSANKSTQRLLSSSSRSNALRPGAITSATPTRNPLNKPADNVDLLSSSLWTSPSSRPSPSLSLDAEKRMNKGDSAVDILQAMPNLDLNKARPDKFDYSAMLDPFPLKDNTSSPPSRIPSAPRVPMRLKPSTGRTITIGTTIDVARGLRLLEQSCARNKVRADATQQRFHERGGLKRKRLRRQRWRKRFLEGFQATVGRVRELKNQGW